MKNKTRIIFRADGNSQIGLGHVIRSLALAEMLSAEFECVFAIQEPALEIQLKIKEICNTIIALPLSEPYSNQYYDELLPYLTGNDLLVLDGYHFDTAYQRNIKSQIAKLICIDDIHAYHFLADVVINHIEGINPASYSVEPYTKLFLGFKYALLRKEFLQAGRDKNKSEPIRNNSVLICLGGADPQNLTIKVLQKCLELHPQNKYFIVVGAAYNFNDQLNKIIEQPDLDIKILNNLNAEAMVYYMKICATAITSASTISYEYLSAGNGILYLLKTAENQNEVYNYLIDKHLALPFQNYNTNIPQSIFTQVYNNCKVFDGNQQKVFISIFKNLIMNKFESDRIYLEKIKLENLDDDFMSWFKDEELMKFYTNSRKEITRNDLFNSITQGEQNNNSFTYGIFFKENNECIGTIKLGPINQVHKISDLVVLIGNKNYHGRGLAVEAIRLGNKLAFEEYDIRKLFGGMYASNVASIKAYTKADWIIEGKLHGHYLVENKPEDRILVGCFNPKYFNSEEIEAAKLPAN